MSNLKIYEQHNIIINTTAIHNTHTSFSPPLSLSKLLHVALKHNRFDTTSTEQLQMLDPFVPLLSSSLSSSTHAKVLCRTLQCLVWVVRLPLRSLSTHLDDIISHIFNLLRRYARAGLAVGENKELVLSSFKVQISDNSL